MADLHYKSKAAHLAVMAELAWRGYNVAMPEIDIGDDIFAVKDDSGNMWRIQVKYGKVKQQKKSISATFPCRKDQLEQSQTPELYYVFVFRKDGWKYVIFSRASLKTHSSTNNWGSPFKQKATGKDYLNFRLTLFDSGELTYGSGANRKNISKQLGNWDEIPKV